jgi:CRP-like cAMP-binding protein
MCVFATMFMQLADFFKLLDPKNQLQPQQKVMVADTVRPVSVVKNHFLQHIGQTCRTIYYTQKGCARVFYMLHEQEITESFSFEGELAVRFESLLTNAPSRRAIQVLEDSEFLAFDMNKLDVIFTNQPFIEAMFRRMFHSYHIQSMERFENMQFRSAEERYQILLTHYPDVVRRVPLKFIASFLGITPVSLSRIRALK